MTAGIAWNAGATRARLIGLHRLGRGGWRDLAGTESLRDALATLQQGPYGHDIEPDMGLPTAQWAVAGTALWHLRVLAGWLPPAGAELARVLAGWWEVLNVENLLASLAGASSFPPYDLGRLDTAWRRLRALTATASLRAALAASPWLDPGADDAATIVTWLQLSWAQRVVDETEIAARLAAGWAALVAARHLFLGGASLGTMEHLRVLGRRWREAEDLPGFRARLPIDAAWTLENVAEPEALWHGEILWWRTLDAGGQRLLRQARSGPEAIVGAFSVLLADAHGVQAALELATRPGSSQETSDEIL